MAVYCVPVNLYFILDRAIDHKSKYCDNLFLLAVVDGDILQYNPRKMDERESPLVSPFYREFLSSL